jgi:ribonuclease P protein subunit RPR2
VILANRILKRKKFVKKIASEQIALLFEQAKMNKENPEKSQRYVDMARNISKRCKVSIPQPYKFQICKHCKSYLVPGVNSRVRIRAKKQSHITVTCLKCKKYKRYLLK